MSVNYQQTIYVVQDNKTDEFVKKYSWKGYGFHRPTKRSQFLTNKLGRARIFESEALANNFKEGCKPMLSKEFGCDLIVMPVQCEVKV